MSTLQLASNIMVAWSFLALAAMGIGLVQMATQQVPILLAAAISVAVYFCHGLYSAGLPIPIAMIGAVCSSAAFAALADYGLGLTGRLSGNKNNWFELAGGLGAYISVQASLTLVFGATGRVFSISREVLTAGSARITSVQVISIVSACIVIAMLMAVITYTRAGRAVRGLGSNEALCTIYGIERLRIRGVAVALGTGVASLGGIFVAFDSGLVPSTGFSLFLIGITAAIIGGAGSFPGIALGSVFLAVTMHAVAYLGDPRWVEAFTALVLIGVLMAKPFGIRGRQSRKTGV